jgi:putative DNA primase/helicase
MVADFGPDLGQSGRDGADSSPGPDGVVFPEVDAYHNPEVAADPPTAARSERGCLIMTPLDLIIDKLQAAGCDPRPTGPDAYESRCPAHGGKRKNLTVQAGEDGRILLHCHHAGENGSPSCPVDAIVGALGLTLADLYPRPNGPPPFKPPPRPKRWPTLDETVAAMGRAVKATSTTTWLYPGRDGKPVMAVVRYETLNGKTYRPLHIRGDGSWVCGDPPRPLPLYRLPEILDGDGISIVEGEKCADALGSINYLATTSAHSAESQTAITPNARVRDRSRGSDRSAKKRGAMSDQLIAPRISIRPTRPRGNRSAFQ